MNNYSNENNRWLEDSIKNSPGLREAVRRTSRPEPQTTFEEFDVPSRPTGEHAQRQIEQAEEQLTLLTAMQGLWENQASEAAANAHREAAQQSFNRKMTWVAFILAGAAVLVPFVILWIERS